MAKRISAMTRGVFICIFFVIAFVSSYSQSYTSYFTGDTADITTQTQPVLVLMGGAVENDNAMRWFLEHSGGGDIVVIRTSGSDGYNDYLYSDLGIAVNSVQTIRFNNGIASQDSYVISQIRNAEALWIAGGDQWKYVSFWKGTPVADAINYVINEKKTPVGGTSAGMAVLSEIVNTAKNGSVTSEEALADPYHPKVQLLNSDFLHHPFMQHVVTDMHYDSPDRRGRHIAFMARVMTDTGEDVYGIACEEYTAVCVDEEGIGHVYGNYPADDDYAYFLQPDCIEPNQPEICEPGTALTWDRGNDALKVYKVPGTQTGEYSFDLNDWITGAGGVWQDWYVIDGVLHTSDGDGLSDCTTAIDEPNASPASKLSVFPSPAVQQVTILIDGQAVPDRLCIYDFSGRLCQTIDSPEYPVALDVTKWNSGVYNVVGEFGRWVESCRLVVIHH